MPPVDPLTLIAGLFATGVLIQWFASRIHVPAIVLLLAAGIVAGPVTGLVDPDEAFGELLRPVVALSVALILLEGGMSLRFSEVKKLGAPLLCLVFGGLVLSFGSISVAAHYIAELDWATSAVIGAILVVTGPTVVKPMLRQARIGRRPALLLKWESIVNDPFGALLAVLVFEIAVHGVSDIGHVILMVVVAGVLGLAGGLLFGQALVRGVIPEHLKTPAILGGGMAVFAGAEEAFHEAGLLAVTIMGVVLANTRSSSVEDVRRFKEEVATILVAVLFLILSARLDFVLADVSVGMVLFVLAVLFVCRPLAGFGSLLFTKLPWQEKFLVGWIAPRGVVAAAMGGALAPRLAEAGYPDAGLLVPVLFGVIVATVVLHSLTVRPLARALGLTGRAGGGVLIVGASDWAVDLAKVLNGSGVDAVIVDENYRNTTQARMRGVEALHGDVLDEETLDELPLERLSWVLAATGDDHYNSLACVSLVKVMGRENVLQLRPRAGGEDESHLNGRMPWSEDASYGRLASRYWRGAHFKCSTLDEDEHDWEEFHALNEGAIALFKIGAKGIEPVEEEGKEPGGEQKVVYLPVPPDKTSRSPGRKADGEGSGSGAVPGAASGVR